jgi:hypothetical protein
MLRQIYFILPKLSKCIDVMNAGPVELEPKKLPMTVCVTGQFLMSNYSFMQFQGVAPWTM